MMHSVLFSIFAATTLATPAATVAPLALHGEHQKPVIKVSTEWDEYSRGQEAQVSVETRDDGYVVVMQADVDGRVRVLFPLDPGDDNFVRGGHGFDIKGRGGKKSFYVDGPGGTGMVYAAYSSVPFHFDAYVSAGHWDYGSLYDKTMDSDFENGFTAIVDKMSTGHFDYDIVRYTVIAEASYSAAGSGTTYVPVGYGGSCWGTSWDGCWGPSWAPGAYLYGPPFGVGFGVGYYGGGWGFSVGFGYPGYGYGYGYPYYGYGYPYYGYGYGYPGYGYGYPGYGYPYYPYHPGYPGYGTPYTPHPYTPPGGGVGYRPRVPGVAGAGFSTPYRTPGKNGMTNVGFGTPASIPHRTPTRSGFTLGRPTYAKPNANGGGMVGSTPARGPNGGSATNGTKGGSYAPPPAAREPHAAPPRYDPNSGRGAPSGGSPGGSTGGSPGGSPGAQPGPKGGEPHAAPSSPPARSEPTHSSPAGKPPMRYGYGAMNDSRSSGWAHNGAAAYTNNGAAHGYSSRPSAYSHAPAYGGGRSFTNSGRAPAPSHSFMGGGGYKAPSGGGYRGPSGGGYHAPSGGGGYHAPSGGGHAAMGGGGRRPH